ncbi:NUDIX hydrolase (plasmid) [Lentzea sp. JNUCC 0626]|uniref:NUDIX hydrolase n=1 Tax=Lentzea sp. JNUCC 0626 TaxID=3367513 RepID=UPI003748E214
MGRETHQNLKASVPPAVRRSARALLVDEQQRLVLIERTTPRQPVYWTTLGGVMEDGESAVAAVRRELLR